MFGTRIARFLRQKPETIRKPTRNGAWQGPGEMNNSKKASFANEGHSIWSIGKEILTLKPIRSPDVCVGGSTVRRAVLVYTFRVCGHRVAFPALVHGGRTGGIVGNFSEVSL